MLKEETDVYFERDLVAIERAFTPQNGDISLGDLLIEFFHFYLFEYREDFDIISICGEKPFMTFVANDPG